MLKRNFRFISIVGFGCTLICTWEVILTFITLLPSNWECMLTLSTRLLSAGLTDGGTAGLIWGFLGVSLGFSLVYASIAEMASM